MLPNPASAMLDPPAQAGDGEPLGIVCGGGSFPLAVAAAAKHAGRRVVLFPIYGFADGQVEAWPHVWIHIAQFGKLKTELRRHGCRDVVIIGNALRPRVRDIRLDWGTLLLVPRILGMLRGGDDHLLSDIARVFEEAGFRLLGAHEIAPEMLIPEGRLSSVAPTPDELDDIEVGRRALVAMGPLDIGQGLVVMKKHVVAIEAAEGTDLMLGRVAELRAIGRIKTAARCGVLVKVPKIGQDLRLDMPSLGPRTVEGAAHAGLAGIAVEAGGVIGTDFDAIIRTADEAGMFIYGFAPDRAS